MTQTVKNQQEQPEQQQKQQNLKINEVFQLVMKKKRTFFFWYNILRIYFI